MNAEQYRALVQKLEAITEAPLELPPGAEPEAGMTVATADDNSGAPPVAAPAAQPVATQPANTIPTIDAPTFSQAYAQAAKQGLKKFKWCGTYAVKARPVTTQPVIPQPKAAPRGTAINDLNPNGSYVGQIGLDSQTPSYSPNSAE